MSRILTALLGAVAVSALFVVPGSAAAEPVASREAAPAPCGPGSGAFCFFSEANFTGAAFSVGDAESGVCYGMPENVMRSARSMQNYAPLEEGYFFAGAGCTGESVIAARGGESRDFGFYAVSYLSACVSCAAEDPRSR
ncbi:peptidase inhibitor family I36 protein [Saccharopolyspora taberi]